MIEVMLPVLNNQGSAGHYGTYQSIIHGVASAREGNLGKLRAKLFPKPMPKFGPKLPRRLVSPYNQLVQLSSVTLRAFDRCLAKFKSTVILIIPSSGISIPQSRGLRREYCKPNFIILSFPN